jgi:hypothetical protein
MGGKESKGTEKRPGDSHTPTQGSSSPFLKTRGMEDTKHHYEHRDLTRRVKEKLIETGDQPDIEWS